LTAGAPALAATLGEGDDSAASTPSADASFDDDDAAEHPSTPESESAIHHENLVRIRLSYRLRIGYSP